LLLHVKKVTSSVPVPPSDPMVLFVDWYLIIIAKPPKSLLEWGRMHFPGTTHATQLTSLHKALQNHELISVVSTLRSAPRASSDQRILVKTCLIIIRSACCKVNAWVIITHSSCTLLPMVDKCPWYSAFHPKIGQHATQCDRS